jgi:hypothetical protein
LPTMFGLQSELLCCFLPKPVRMFRTTNQTQVCQAFSDGGQPKIAISTELQGHMGLSIGPKMRLKGHTVRARLRKFRQQSCDRRIASIRRQEEPCADRFFIGGHCPARTVLNLEHRIPEPDLGSCRNGMIYQSVIKMFSADPAFPPDFVWKLKSDGASPKIKELDPEQFGRR